MIRIMIADDHHVVRSGLRTILDAQPYWEVVAEAADGREAVLKAIETKPDVVVLDYSLPLINGYGTVLVGSVTLSLAYVLWIDLRQ